MVGGPGGGRLRRGEGEGWCGLLEGRRGGLEGRGGFCEVPLRLVLWFGYFGFWNEMRLITNGNYFVRLV